jgi:hypothetical protein
MLSSRFSLYRTILVAALLWFGISAQCEPIIGIGNGIGGSAGVLYSINPLTGAVNAIGLSGTSNGYYPISSGPIAGSYFAISPVNHYLESYSQPGTTQPPFGQWEYHGGGFFLTDFAFDSSNGKLFSLTESTALGGPEGLVQLTNTGPYAACPTVNCYNLAATGIAQAPALPNLSIIEYINGLGLYGTDGHNAYLINETTGATTQLPDLTYTGPIITGLAYDPDSGRLIGVAGSLPGLGGSGGPSTIYDIDPLTGAVNVLNANAPDMYGLAAVSRTLHAIVARPSGW